MRVSVMAMLVLSSASNYGEQVVKIWKSCNLPSSYDTRRIYALPHDSNGHTLIDVLVVGLTAVVDGGSPYSLWNEYEWSGLMIIL